MERSTSPLSGWVRCAAVLALLPAAGCVATGNLALLCGAKPLPPAQVEAVWNKQVAYSPDPTRGGVPSPGLAGRVYVLTATDMPIPTEGALVVDLFEDTPQPGGGFASRHLEQWTFDCDTLQKLRKKDGIGEGYSVFLPWGSYRPDIGQVHLTAQFTPTGGGPLYSSSSPLTLDHGSPPIGAAVRPGLPSLPGPAMPGQTMPPAIPIKATVTR